MTTETLSHKWSLYTGLTVIANYENNLSSKELSSLKTLVRNKNIDIQKADKGNTIVKIDKEKYIQGVKNAIFNIQLLYC